MTTEKKNIKQASKRSALHSPIDTEQINNYVVKNAVDWSDDYEFLSPNEIFMNSIGLLFNLTSKRLIQTPFINLYKRSLKIKWMNLLIRERCNLKSNVNSVEKCFILNRLITECKKDPFQFARQTGELYEEIKMRISAKVPPAPWAFEDIINQVELWRTVQSQRRLYYISHSEAKQPHSLLTLQCIITQMYSHLLRCYQSNSNNENYNCLQKLLANCFIIIIQPSIPECVAATKYDKSENKYLAKLHSRVLCLLDPSAVDDSLQLFDVGVTLFPFVRNADLCGERQEELKWHKRQILDTENIQRSFLYVELQAIELTQTDRTNSKPLYNSKMFQIEFEINIRINVLNIVETVRLNSQNFGICSHAQYYPDYVAQVLLYEVTQTLESKDSLIQPNILTEYINRYLMRISGVALKIYTAQYITEILQNAYEEKARTNHITSVEIYQGIVAKLISQMETFTDYPFLAMMYHDGLFLSICDKALDQQLHGTRQQPHILIRFNSLAEHQSVQSASIKFIVHNGQLTRAVFHSKAFIDEMCEMICKANSCENINTNFQLEVTNRKFHEFSLYFDNELYRLSSSVSQVNGAYQPLIPILWDMMRISAGEQPKQNEEQLENSFSFDIIPTPVDVSQSSNCSTDFIPNEVADFLMNTSTENIPSASNNITRVNSLLFTMPTGETQQRKEILMHLLHDYFQSKTYAEAATQTLTFDSNSTFDPMLDDV
ncbi:unnamed protein product [Rotaria magnacalcarata]|uniref:Uncharacterized protein n=1 Tax=Rotaria magnacalcarata TaxID=392030 RepID=A0A816MQA2_9BILA|nr:unnamed protein product [Rotaria magnacalcarata]